MQEQSAQVTDPAKGQTENVSELKTNQFDLLNHFDFDGSIVIGELKAGPVTLAQIKSPMSRSKWNLATFQSLCNNVRWKN